MNDFKKKFKKIFKKKDMFGSVSVIDHKLHIKDPADPDGEFPSIEIPFDDRLQVMINNEKVVGVHKLTNQDKVEITLAEPKEPEITLEHRVSDDQMTVFLKKNVNMGTKYVLKNFVPSIHHRLEIEEVSYIVPHTKEQLIDYLNEHKFVGEINEVALQQIALSHDTIELSVLEGKEPIEGIPAHYELVIELNDIMFIPKRTTFAKFVDEIPPTFGKDVTGKEVKLSLLYKLPVIKDGVTEDKGVLTSSRDGRLEFEQNYIRIVPQLIITRDLTSEDGLISSDEGDIIVEGSALEGSFIKATGSVKIDGGVHYATILTDTSININHNLSYSKVYAGWTEIAYQRLLKNTENLYSLSLEFKSQHHKIQNEISKKRNILESEFSKWIKNIKLNTNDELLMHVPTLGNDELKYTLSSYKELTKTLLMLKLSSSESEIETCVASIQQLLNRLKDREKGKPCDVIVGSVDSSEIHATGNIEIVSSGAYLSHLESGDTIRSVGGIKGGILIAKNSVSVKKFKTVEDGHYIRVLNPNGFIEMEKRRPFSLLIVGDYEDTNDKTEEYVRFERIVKNQE